MRSTDIVVDYSQLENIAKQFDINAQETSATLQTLIASLDSLRPNFISDAADAFFGDMEHNVLPPFQRLVKALHQGNQTTLAVKRFMEEAEEEACNQLPQGESNGFNLAGALREGAIGLGGLAGTILGGVLLGPTLGKPFGEGVVEGFLDGFGGGEKKNGYWEATKTGVLSPVAEELLEGGAGKAAKWAANIDGMPNVLKELLKGGGGSSLAKVVGGKVLGGTIGGLVDVGFDALEGKEITGKLVGTQVVSGIAQDLLTLIPYVGAARVVDAGLQIGGNLLGAYVETNAASLANGSKIAEDLLRDSGAGMQRALGKFSLDQVSDDITGSFITGIEQRQSPAEIAKNVGKNVGTFLSGGVELGWESGKMYVGHTIAKYGANFDKGVDIATNVVNHVVTEGPKVVKDIANAAKSIGNFLGL